MGIVEMNLVGPLFLRHLKQRPCTSLKAERMASLVLERVGCMGLVYLLLVSPVALSSCFGRGGEEPVPLQPNNDFTPLFFLRKPFPLHANESEPTSLCFSNCAFNFALCL